MHPILMRDRNLVVRLSSTASLHREDVATDGANGWRGLKPHPRTPKMLLEPDASAVLREELIILTATKLLARQRPHRAALGSTKALSIFDSTVLAEPCSPEMASAKDRGRATAAPS
jgi:hypothetical protein